MQITLSDEQMKEITDQVKEKVFNEALKMARDEMTLWIRNGQFVSQIRNAMVKECVADLKERVLKKVMEGEVIQKSVQAAEQRVNQLLHIKLKDGIKVSFDTEVFEVKS